MKAKVNQSLCIGCGACEAIACNEFKLNDDGYSDAINDVVSKENEDAVLDAKEACPTSAIEIEEEK